MATVRSLLRGAALLVSILSGAALCESSTDMEDDEVPAELLAASGQYNLVTVNGQTPPSSIGIGPAGGCLDGDYVVDGGSLWLQPTPEKPFKAPDTPIMSYTIRLAVNWTCPSPNPQKVTSSEEGTGHWRLQAGRLTLEPVTLQSSGQQIFSFANVAFASGAGTITAAVSCCGRRTATMMFRK